jgi:hypothetical protein
MRKEMLYSFYSQGGDAVKSFRIVNRFWNPSDRALLVRDLPVLFLVLIILFEFSDYASIILMVILSVIIVLICVSVFRRIEIPPFGFFYKKMNGKYISFNQAYSMYIICDKLDINTKAISDFSIFIKQKERAIEDCLKTTNNFSPNDFTGVSIVGNKIFLQFDNCGHLISLEFTPPD